MKKWKRVFSAAAIVVFVLVLSACGNDWLGENENERYASNNDTNMNEQNEFPTLQLPVDEGAGFCDGHMQTFVTGFDVLKTPKLSETPPRQSFIDPVFSSCIVRVTDRKNDLSPGDDSAGLKNEYSRVQAFNADGSLLLARGIEGTWYVYDARSLEPLGEVPVWDEPRWDAGDPNILYFNDETKLKSYHLNTGTVTTLHDFADDFPDENLTAVWTRYEGSPSQDTRYWGMMVEDEDWETIAFLIYDLEEDRVIAKRMLSRPEDVDSVTISPSGDYFLAFFEYCERGQMGTEKKPCGLMIYDQELKNGRGVLRVVGHGDIAYDANLREVFVYQGIDTDYISMLDLGTGTITELWPIDFSHTPIGLHFSGAAYDLPGWALVSTYDGDPGAYTWMDDQVFALELKPGGRVVRLAHTHSLVDENQDHDYWAEPHATVNQDFTRVLFTSNWGRSGTGKVEMYAIFLPENWPDLLP